MLNITENKSNFILRPPLAECLTPYDCATVKSELIVKDATKNHRFPLIAKHRNTEGVGLVILFNAPTKGVVLNNAHETWKIGDYYDGWVTVENTHEWEILPSGSQVVLTQE